MLGKTEDIYDFISTRTCDKEILYYAKEGKLDELKDEVNLAKNCLEISNSVEELVKDILCIKEKIQKYGIEQPCLRHCCNPSGEGYWALWHKTSPEERHYIQSSLRLQKYGLVVSEHSLIRLILFDIYLCDFLFIVSQECTAEMNIKHLYLPYIFKGLYRRKIDSDFFQYLDAERMLDDLAKKHGNLFEVNEFEYYNGDDEVFYVVNESIKECIKDIYYNRNDLERYGLWDDAHDVIQQLQAIERRKLAE